MNIREEGDFRASVDLPDTLLHVLFPQLTMRRTSEVEASSRDSPPSLVLNQSFPEYMKTGTKSESSKYLSDASAADAHPPSSWHHTQDNSDLSGVHLRTTDILLCMSELSFFRVLFGKSINCYNNSWFWPRVKLLVSKSLDLPIKGQDHGVRGGGGGIPQSHR